ncbi:MAG TPA: PAS domain S-box protein [Smithellaceae bacterium]|nr:PAS domain S-box protein [Smithellaceae bacterium]
MLIPLRVLIVEDSEDDTLLLLRELKKAGYEPSAQRVETADDMAYALMTKPWDMILSDYHMPAFSGLHAIALLKKTGLDIPIIIVSGAIGEETALDCIHRGASDYIMKGNPARLGLSVRRELEKKDMRLRQRESDEALRRSEEKYRSILENIQDGYYEVDLKGNFTFFNNALVKIWGYPKEDLLGMNSRAYTDPETAKKLYAEYNRVFSTGKPGGLLDYEIIRKDGTRRTVQSLFSLLTGDDGHPAGFSGIVRDITQIKQLEKEREEYLERLRQSLTATIRAIAIMVESRDPYTAGHQKRVAELARAIAQEMKLDVSQVDGLWMAATIHDVGKIAIPSEILTKPTKLTQVEFDLVKTHAQAGYEILKDIDFPWPIARMVLEHHEKINGAGYPNRLTSEKILLESKILVVADVVEAMASHRPYRPALGIGAALDEIRKNRGALYDAQVVDVCLNLFEKQHFAFKE